MCALNVVKGMILRMKIKVHYTYILVAISFVLCGYFANLVIFTSIILVHEAGHMIMARVNGIKIGKITIYPYGGQLDLDIKVNTPIKQELMVACGGFLSQTVFYILIFICYDKGLIREYIFNLFTVYYQNILFFNMLPIYPLDGSKILRLVLDYWLPYKIVNYVNIIISLVVLIMVVSFNIYKFNYTFVMIGVIIIDNLVKCYRNLDYYFNLFLLERYLYKYDFKKRRIIRKMGEMQKDKYHFFENKGGYEAEGQVLARKFRGKR